MIRRARDLVAGFLLGLAARWALEAIAGPPVERQIERAMTEIYGRAVDTGELVDGLRIQPLTPAETAAALRAERELARLALEDPEAIAG